MKISTKGDYGIRALIELALHYGEGRPIQNAEIAARQNIPESYLGQLLTMLRRAGFIRSIRGTQGGHILIRPPNGILISEVITALEGSILPIDCLEESSQCTQNGGCAQRDLWTHVRDAIVQVLESATVADLAAKEQQLRERNGHYAI